MNILDQILQADTQLFVDLNSLGQSQWDQFWIFMTNKESWFPMYGAFIIIAFLLLRNWKRALLSIVVLALLILAVDQSIGELIKPWFSRLRPCYFPDLDGLVRIVKGSCGGKYSFFSAHSSNAFAYAVFITSLLKDKLKGVTLFLMIWAALVAYSRIYVGVHFPLDILIGGLYGALLGYLFYQLYVWVCSRFLA